MLQKITAPVPPEAAVSPQGVASFQINGIDVVAEPDSTTAEEKYRNRAYTQVGLWIDQPAGDIMVDTTTNVVQSFTPPHLQAKVKTVFGPGFEPSGRSGYGRGTTTQDVRAGDTSVQFHESRHGADWFDFLRQNAAPVFRGAVGMSLTDFRAAHEQLEKDVEQYNHRASAYSVRATDCPGTPATEEQLRPFGYSAAICHQQ